MTEDQIKHMVDRFLGWRLPENFSPDAGVSFKKTFNDHMPTPTKNEPSGTNLFDATQADAMVRYLIEGMPLTGTPAQRAVGREELDKLIQRHASAYVTRGHAISDSIIAECKASREALLAAFAAQPPAAPACSCGGDAGQPADHHDISCPLALSPSSADTVDALAKTIWLAGFERAFSRTPTDPWENQAESAKAPHINTARKIIEAGFVTAGEPQRAREKNQ